MASSFSLESPPVRNPHGRALEAKPPVACSIAMRRALDRLELFAQCDEVVLLEGEPGVGKTRLAEYLHRHSRRRRGPFFCLDVAVIDDALASSDLFGHARGSFTGAMRDRSGALMQAQRGTLFLDEIGRATVRLQQKLLRVIEYGEMRRVGEDHARPVDVRIVLATNVSLESLVRSGAFLSDLYSRVEGFRVTIPPLRDRREDIPSLAGEIVSLNYARFGFDAPPLVDDHLLDALQAEVWPGNVRQLDRALRRVLSEARGAPTLLRAHWKRVEPEFNLALSAEIPSARHTFPTADRIRAVAHTLVRPSLNALARALSVPRNTLRRRLPDDVRQRLLECRRDELSTNGPDMPTDMRVVDAVGRDNSEAVAIASS